MTELRKRLAAAEEASRAAADETVRKRAEQAVEEQQRVAEQAEQEVAMSRPALEAAKKAEEPSAAVAAASMVRSSQPGTGKRKPRCPYWVLVRDVSREIFAAHRDEWRQEVVRVTGDARHADTYMQVAGNKELRIGAQTREACERLARARLAVAGRAYAVEKLKI